MRFPDLTPILEPIPWAVVGAVGARLYMPERATRDLDIVVQTEDADTVRGKLSDGGFDYQGDLTIGRSSWVSPDGVAVDVIELAEPWLGEALREAEGNLDAQGLPVLPFRYLVLTKFEAGRVQDLADLTRMLGQASEEMLSSVRELFAELLGAETDDLESLIQLGQLEMGTSED